VGTPTILALRPPFSDLARLIVTPASRFKGANRRRGSGHREESSGSQFVHRFFVVLHFFAVLGWSWSKRPAAERPLCCYEYARRFGGCCEGPCAGPGLRVGSPGPVCGWSQQRWGCLCLRPRVPRERAGVQVPHLPGRPHVHSVRPVLPGGGPRRPRLQRLLRGGRWVLRLWRP
jgi:hypothetical protein